MRFLMINLLLVCLLLFGIVTLLSVMMRLSYLLNSAILIQRRGFGERLLKHPINASKRTQTWI